MFKEHKVSFTVFVDILISLVSLSVDLHILVNLDPDPESQNVSDYVKTYRFLKSIFLLQYFDDILPLGSWSLDLHIFADLDPNSGSQNVANPDPKHCVKLSKQLSFIVLENFFPEVAPPNLRFYDFQVYLIRK